MEKIISKRLRKKEIFVLYFSFSKHKPDCRFISHKIFQNRSIAPHHKRQQKTIAKVMQNMILYGGPDLKFAIKFVNEKKYHCTIIYTYN